MICADYEHREDLKGLTIMSVLIIFFCHLEANEEGPVYVRSTSKIGIRNQD